MTSLVLHHTLGTRRSHVPTHNDIRPIFRVTKQNINIARMSKKQHGSHLTKLTKCAIYPEYGVGRPFHVWILLTRETRHVVALSYNESINGLNKCTQLGTTIRGPGTILFNFKNALSCAVSQYGRMRTDLKVTHSTSTSPSMVLHTPPSVPEQVLTIIWAAVTSTWKDIQTIMWNKIIRNAYEVASTVINRRAWQWSGRSSAGY